MPSQRISSGSTSRTTARIVGALLFAAFLGAAAMPAGVAQTTLVDVTIQNPLFADFDDGPQEWTANPGETPVRPPPTSTWEWGAPTNGPKVAASGSNVWATHLASNYTANECAGLATPPIDLTGATSASISFNHWRHLEQSSATSTGWDAGALMVTTDGGQTFTRITATGYTTNSLGTSARACLDGGPTSTRAYTGPFGTAIPAPTYTNNAADLSDFVGQTIQVVFTFGSDGSGHRSGWYLDDVATTVDGVTNTQDFESSDGGFSVIGTKTPTPVALGWSHGVPAGGPAATDAMWATNINGNHGPSECHWLESPPIDLGPLPADASVAARATLSWEQWYRTSSFSAAGVVQIGDGTGYTIVAPTTGYPAKPTSSVLNACLGHIEPGLGAFSGLIDPVGGEMVPYEIDLTEYLGQTITVRYLFASTTSTSTNPGWYVDDVNVEIALTADAPGTDDLPLPGGGTNAPGWTSGGPVNSWAFGVTTTNPVGHTTYKTNLNGNHDLNECSFIESPAVPGALAATAGLSFEHWHRIPGTSVNVPWAAGIVLISEDGGLTWTHLAMNDYNKNVYEPPIYTEIYDECLAAWGADSAGRGYGMASTSVAGNVDGWYTSSATLTDYADAPSVKIRFAYASDGTFDYEGWAIRSVTLGGVKLL